MCAKEDLHSTVTGMKLVLDRIVRVIGVPHSLQNDVKGWYNWVRALAQFKRIRIGQS